MTRIVPVALLAVALTACSYPSTYVRETAEPGEIVWAYDTSLIATRDGQPIARPTTWGGLTEAVACVDEARTYAEEAESKGTWGQALAYTGAGVMLTSPVLGLATGIAVGAGVGFGTSALTNEPLFALYSFPIAYVTTLGATFLFLMAGAATSVGGNVLVAQAWPPALDAVNVYNDNFATEPACQAPR